MSELHTVAILALHSLVPSDLAIPHEVFCYARTSAGEPAYRVQVCGEAALVRTESFDLAVRHGLAEAALADTVIVPGLVDPLTPVSPEVTEMLLAAAGRGARIASVCTGAFVLAAAGLLDGRRATTHWHAADDLARLYPAVSVDPDVLYVDEENVVTSAGASAALDLCLHLVRRDHGHAVAAQTARMAVAPLMREGGQAQFIRREQPSGRPGVNALLDWMLRHLDRPLCLAELAREAGMSVRTLNRRFQDEVGVPPLQWLLAARRQRAQELLETTGLSVAEVAVAAGFPAVSSFRERFRRDLGVSPDQYRRMFRER
ncbi:MAG TPA: helix-turn-helix domain-containing protein [Beijerinckiaceae bacterium]|jgi:transcriptional regulator GlxA family with amidase domain